MPLLVLVYYYSYFIYSHFLLRHRPRKLWTGFNVLFVSAAVSLITAKIIKGEIHAT